MCSQKIKKHENAHAVYQKQLLSEGVVKQEQIDEIHTNISKLLAEEYAQARFAHCPAACDLLPAKCTGRQTTIDRESRRLCSRPTVCARLFARLMRWKANTDHRRIPQSLLTPQCV